MKRFQEQLKNSAENVKLSYRERQDLRERLVSYLEYHPLPADKRQPLPMVKAGRQTVIRFNAWLVGRAASALAVLFLVVVPVAAERAVPGDTLYPIKVKFNEEVRGTLTFSPYQKVEWETERLERRIAEARLLADGGKLTPEVEAEVAEAVKQHSDAAKEEIATIRKSDNDEASIAEINFTSALEVQSEVLEVDLEKDTNTDTSSAEKPISTIANAVNEARSGVAPANMGPESYDKLLARLEAETTRAHEYFASIAEAASADEKRNVERRLSDIEFKVSTATADTDDRAAAVTLLSAALSDTRKLISFITNIDVRENVDIEELVPLSLSKEERLTLLDQQVSDTEALVVIAREHMTELATSSEAYLAAEVSLTAIGDYLTEVETNLAADELELAETAALKAFEAARALELATRETAEDGEEVRDDSDSEPVAETES